MGPTERTQAVAQVPTANNSRLFAEASEEGVSLLACIPNRSFLANLIQQVNQVWFVFRNDTNLFREALVLLE